MSVPELKSQKQHQAERMMRQSAEVGELLYGAKIVSEYANRVADESADASEQAHFAAVAILDAARGKICGIVGDLDEAARAEEAFAE